MLGLSEKPFVLSSLGRARAENLFEKLEAIYSEVPPSTCRRRALCCRESPRIYFVEFLNIYNALMRRPARERAMIQGRSVRYAFLDLCDPAIRCPLLEDNSCLLYAARGLRCRLWGHLSKELYDRQAAAAKRAMAEFNKLMNKFGLHIPEEILSNQLPYCRVEVEGPVVLTDEDAQEIEERLRHLESRFCGTEDAEERHVDFARHLYAALFGLRGYGNLRVRIMREYLERASEESLRPLVERARTITLS